MKKFIKIFSLVLFIIFVLGITTSKALTVDTSTTAEQMLTELRRGGSLTGLTSTIKNGNSFLYCRNINISLQPNATYYFANDKNEEKSKVIYDTTTPYDNENEYAKAYILADDKFPKYPDRQTAWWQILGQKEGENDLLKVAKDYQDFKKTEKDVNITNTDAKTNISGSNIVYGPIKIEYSYATGTRTSTQFGGFNYAFFDNNNNISDKVNLCILENNTYTPITATKNNNGYYEVRTIDYNNINLYVVTQDKSIGNITLKMQENKEDYKAEVYEIAGTYYVSNTYTVYCMECQDKMENAVTNYADAVKKGRTVIKIGDKYYEYSGSTTEYVYIRGTKGTTNNVYRVDGSDITAPDVQWGNVTFPANYLTSYRCTYCSKWYTGTKDKAATNLYSIHYKYPHYCGEHTSGKWQCIVCHYGRCNNSNDYYSHKSGTCTFSTQNNLINHFRDNHLEQGRRATRVVYNFEKFSGCGRAYTVSEGWHYSQPLFIVNTTTANRSDEIKEDVKIELSASIEVTKKWEDYGNTYNLRPENLKFNVFRSTDKQTWTKVSEKEYTVEIEGKESNTWKILISGLVRVDDKGKEYSFKVEEQELNCYKAAYPNGNEPKHDAQNPTMWYIDITNSLKKVNLGGYVWLDGQTGIKPAIENNGKMDKEETRLENIVVYLYYENPTNKKTSKIAETTTDKNGHYEFKNYEIGKYYVEFYYDGVHYEDTISGGSSKAFEKDASRNTFNGRFKTITYGKSNDGTILKYNYADKKSTLITNEDGKTTIKKEFQMTAESSLALVSANVDDLNLGLVKRGTDIALSTDVSDAKVTINGQVTDYTYNKEDNNIEIGTSQTQEKVSYNLNLYASDYNYRIRDYVNTQDFKEKDYINDGNPGIKTGDDLKVYVTYELNLQNQSTETTKINEVKYVHDEKYTFIGLQGSNYSTQKAENVVTIDLNGLELKEGETKTLYLVFEVKETNNAVNLGNFTNKAEITSYSTDKGLIDVDSQPGNLINGDQVEDDSDTAGGLTIKTEDSFERKITGKVFDKAGNNVNDVIVQLIELKTVNGKQYEYIWQETVSGTEKGLRLNSDGTALETYAYSKADGYYEFKGFIPGDYIVRFIYGDAIYTDVLYGDVNCDGNVDKDDVEYLMRWLSGWNDYVISEQGKLNADVYKDGKLNNKDGSILLKYLSEIEGYESLPYIPDGSEENVEKFNTEYNGQDYKSVADVNYNAEWYNTSSYSTGASVARDNEARRLETMAYSVEIDAEKGVLLKLLNNVTVDDLNETEKEIIIATYNKIYDPDITQVTDEVINKLLKEQVLKNTWMCAETSKIKVAVETENVTNINSITTVNGITGGYVKEISNINLGLEKRPETKIELKKYITGFKLIASDGTTLVNAYANVNEYLNGTTDISNKVQGIRDNVTILNTVWQYEVSPTNINTVVDGAKLEFEYTLVVKNTGETDYLSSELANVYNNNDIGTYKNTLTNKAAEIKGYMRNGTYKVQIGKTVGKSYYVGGSGAAKVLTEVTNIRDYINNDLTFVESGGKVAIDENASHTHRILRDDYSMQSAEIKTILKTTETTGKMENNGAEVLYTVTLGKNPISSTGNLNFETYIAEVMSYTNAAGRRTIDSTPGNAEIVDHEHREGKSHEIDEADTGRIQIGVATGEDEKTNYTIIVAVAAGIAVIALGAYMVKKFFLK